MTQTLSAPTTDFTVVRHDNETRTYFTITVDTVAGSSPVKDSDGNIREFSTRASARKAITRLRRSIYTN